jgi:hypothetical protein
VTETEVMTEAPADITPDELEALVTLDAEPTARQSFAGLLYSAATRLSMT